MTVTTTDARVAYSGDGTTLVFTVPFYFFENGDLAVYLTVSGVTTRMTLTTDYTVSGAGNSAGGSVSFLSAPASGAQVTIIREPKQLQETDYQANDPFPAETHERALDRLTMIAQHLQTQIDRSFRIDVSGDGATFPAPVANRLIGWNGAATALENKEPGSAFAVDPLSGALAQSAGGTGATTLGAGTVTPTGGSVARSLQDILGETVVSIRSVGGDPGEDITTALQSLLTDLTDSGRLVYIPAAASSYKLSARVTVPSGTGIICESHHAVIEADAASFVATDPTTRSTSGTVMLDLSGELSGSFIPSSGQKLINLRLKGTAANGRVLDPIYARNCSGLIVRDAWLSDFSVARFKCDTWDEECVVDGLLCTDWTNSATPVGGAASNMQITGLDVDADRVNSTESVGVSLRRLRFRNLRQTGAALTAYGHQSDGLNLQSGRNFTVDDVYAEDVGEMLDCFASDSVFTSLRSLRAYAGMKFIYGASRNVVVGFDLRDSGIIGLYLSAATISDVESNRFIRGSINGIDPLGVNAATQLTACIKIDDSGDGFNCIGNEIEADLRTGTNGEHHVLVDGASNARNTLRVAIQDTAAISSWAGSGLAASYFRHPRPTFARGHLAADWTALPSGVWTTVPLNTESADEAGDMALGATAGRVTFARPGRYRITAQLRSSGGLTGGSIRLIRNGATLLTQADGSAQTLTVQHSAYFAVGDYVDFQAFQTSGINATVTGGIEFTWMDVYEV